MVTEQWWTMLVPHGCTPLQVCFLAFDLKTDTERATCVPPTPPRTHRGEDAVMGRHGGRAPRFSEVQVAHEEVSTTKLQLLGRGHVLANS